MARVPQNIREPRLPIHMVSAPVSFGALVPRIFHLHDKNGGCQAANFRHRSQIQTSTVPKKFSCKPSFNLVIFSVVSISHFRFVSRSRSFASCSSVHFLPFFASRSQLTGYQLLANVSVVSVEFSFTINSFY